jgi:hypothetical protein
MQLLIQYIRNCPPKLGGVSCICNLRTRHAVVTRDLPNMVSCHRVYFISVEFSDCYSLVATERYKQTNNNHEFHVPKQEKTSMVSYVLKHQFMNFSWMSSIIISSQNILYVIQCTPRHVSLLIVAFVQLYRGRCGQCDKHTQCDSVSSLSTGAAYTRGFRCSHR